MPINLFRCESYLTHELSMHCFRNATTSLMAKFLENINLYHIFEDCVNEEGSSQAFPCVPTSNVANYLNRADVQKQIHVSLEHADLHWSTCRLNGPHLVDKDEFNASLPYLQYVQEYRSVRPFLQKAIERGVRVFFLYGDSDAICNFLTGQMFADYLGSKITPKRAWPTGRKIYGFLTSYTNYYFATVLGAGHMAAQHKPLETASFIQAFINNTLD